MVYRLEKRRTRRTRFRSGRDPQSMNGLAGGGLSQEERFRATGKIYTDADDTFFLPMRLLEQRTAEAVKNPYTQHVWAYAAIQARSEAMCQVPLKAGRRDREGKLIPVEESNPWQRLFDQPNPSMSGSDMLAASVISWDIYGEILYFLLNNPDGSYDSTRPPRETWIVPNPRDWEPIIESGVIVAWKDRQDRVYAAQQVIQIKSWNPQNPFRGLPPMAPLSRTIQGDHKARLFLESYMDNGADPGGTLTSDMPVSEEQRRDIREAWESRHKGVLNRGRVAVLENGLRYEPITVSFDSMQFLDLRASHRDEILAAYRVPKQEVALIEDVNRATSATVKRIWWQNSLIPFLKRIAKAWRRVMEMAPMGSAAILAFFDFSMVEALQEDFGEKLDKALKLRELGYPLNAINSRLELGMDDVDHGDVVLGPPNQVPLVDLIESPGAFLPSKTQSEPQSRALVVKAMAESYERTFRHPAETELRAAIRRYFKDMADEQAKAVAAWARDKGFGEHETRDDGLPVSSDDVDRFLLSPRRFADRMKALAARPLGRISLGALRALGSQIGGLDVIEPDLSTPWIKRLTAKRLAEMVKLAAGDRALIRETIMEQVNSGGFSSIREIQALLKKKFQAWRRSRSLAIARTETGHLANSVRHEGMRREGIERHEWSTAGDEVVRPGEGQSRPVGQGNHRALHGQIVEVGQAFPNGLLYPLDPNATNAAEVVNCRCVALPVVETES